MQTSCFKDLANFEGYLFFSTNNSFIKSENEAHKHKEMWSPVEKRMALFINGKESWIANCLFSLEKI